MKNRIIYSVVWLMIGLSSKAHAQTPQEPILLDQRQNRDMMVLIDQWQRSAYSEYDRAKAIYQWIAHHIQYDLDSRDLMNELAIPTANEVFEAKKGLCSHYVILYTEMARHMGIQVLPVAGRARQDGRDDPYAHEWLVARLDGRWCLIDPTWASGYVEQERFVKDYTAEYFDIHPDTLIRTHYPYDPIFQLRLNPLTEEEFTHRKPAQTLSNFQVADSLALYRSQSELERMQASLRRAQKGKYHHHLTQVYMDRLRENIATLIYNQNVGRFNEVVALFNQIGPQYNAYFSARDTQAGQAVVDQLLYARRSLKTIDTTSATLKSSVRQMHKDIDQMLHKIAWPMPEFQTGDIIFQGWSGSFSDAIRSVTTSVFSHVGIVEKRRDGLYVLEAIGKGVVATPMEDFWNRPTCMVNRVYRLKPEYRVMIPQTIEQIKRVLGRPYDYAFSFENDDYYCTELIYQPMAKISKDPHFFNIQPMTFKDPVTGLTHPNWVELYQRKGMEVPEGRMGLSPENMAKSEKIERIW